MRLSVTGFLQVFFVAINAYSIAHGLVAVLVLSSFCISYLWSSNVRKIAFGTYWDRIEYSIGASLGCLSGYLIATELQRLLV